MLSRIIAAVLRGGSVPWRAARRRIARSKVRRALACYAAGRRDAAKVLGDSALRQAPPLPEVSYAIGLIACCDGDAQAGAAAIARAVELAPGERRYLAALADAQLLLQRPDAALPLYLRAFPGHTAALEALPVSDLPWKRVHPDWIRDLHRVTLPLQFLKPGHAPGEDPLPGALVESCHLLNWALVLVGRRRVPLAIYLLQQAVALNPALGYGHAALALLHTLNREWSSALEAALRARSLKEDVFPGATDLCVLGAQLGTGCPVHALDPIFDWSALAARPAAAAWSVDELPPVEGLPLPSLPEQATLYFVPCDPRYFFEYGVALACSIHESAAEGALHFHLYNPTPELWARWEELRARLDSLVFTATWERVDYDAFGGIGPYCIMARFARLYQVLGEVRPGSRVVMLDADSLVRGDPGAALAAGREIGLAHAANEPFWHQYLGGFVTFRATALARHFLMRLGRFLSMNLAAGRSRAYMDQVAMYVCMNSGDEEIAAAVDELPIAVFCDTLFGEQALIWSVTQRKSADSAFDQGRRVLLARYGWLEEGGPRSPPVRPGEGSLPAAPG
jgi:tetratricopeptide (TPR) repeat protein